MKSELVAHCLELLAPLGTPRARRMFGGHGFYVDDVFMALIIGERFYLKVDDATRARFDAAGCEPFVFVTREGARVSMNYCSAPEEAMESPALMLPWARLALEAALRARAAKPAKKPRAQGAGPRARKAAAKTGVTPGAAAPPRRRKPASR
jgi:DNA transformation protein and related proteins